MVSQVPPEVLELIAAAARDTGVEVYHAEISGRELRVQVESQSGASVRACSEFSHALTTRLDAADFLHRQFTLEVSTPGIERRLYQPLDFLKAVNQSVRLHTRDGVVDGRLEAAGPESVTLRTDRNQKSRGRESGIGSRESTLDSPLSTPDDLREIAFTDIREARIRVSDSELFARSRTDPKTDIDATKTRKTRNGELQRG
jgi:ribosome maturation factor RimP